jgi:hypothetical protein
MQRRRVRVDQGRHRLPAAAERSSQPSSGAALEQIDNEVRLLAIERQDTRLGRLLLVGESSDFHKP